jgi:prepilin-type N-terminal cleavage/methylation domain-containing protein
VRCRAFTLIEVMAAVALMGLLAMATVWSLAEDARNYRQADVAGRIAQADRMARLAAQRLGRPCVLRFDLGRQRVRRVAADDGPGEEPAHTLRLPAPYRIDRVLVCSAGVPEGGGPQPLGAARTDWGAVDIAFSTAGRSATYAVRLSLASRLARLATKDSGGLKTGADALDSRPTWLVFSGLTGQMVLTNDEDEIENLFAAIATGGPDAP